MANEVQEPYEDDLGIEIEIYVRDGEVFQVDLKGQQTRAKVYDYDVKFPCVAQSLGTDEDGEMFAIIVV